MSTFVIGICGGSASGKTTLAGLLSERLGTENSNIISLDNYYHDVVSRGIEPSTINYDHPQSIDIKALAFHLKLLCSGRTVEIPRYNFDTHTRADKGFVLYPCRYIIVEGLFLFTNRILKPAFQLKIYVETPDPVRLQRRIERDIRERGRSVDSVLEQYKKFVYPMHVKYVFPNLKFADLVVKGDKPFAEQLPAILKHVECGK